MLRQPSRTLLLAGLLSILIAGVPSRAAVVHRPKLVIALVIDQFRADYLLRFESRFAPAQGAGGEVGGFEYLMSKGAYYPMAEYGVLQSMTCPGHATILTGSYPYRAGIPLNGWYDSAAGRFVYCVEDPAYQIVGAPTTEHDGTSPMMLNATTVGDELKNAGFKSRVVAVALKDRAAILLGGHRADLAFWMDAKMHSWVSSTFYLPQGKLPEWLVKLNQEIKPKPGEKIRWDASGAGSGLSDPQYVPRRDTLSIGKSFPRAIDADEPNALALPYGLELTEQAAERALDAEKLGRGPAPDILAISFSSHDYIGHAFGPNSREAEEMTAHEDKLLAKLFNHVRKSLPGGLSDVVITLTGDHGTPPDPTWAKAHRIDAGSVDEEAVTAELEKTLNAKFGEPKNAKWIPFNHDFDLFVSREAVQERKAALSDVLATVQQDLSKKHWAAHVVTRTDYEAHKLPLGLDGEQFAHTYYPKHSGDIVVIPRPYWMVDGGDNVTHLTGYSYDRMVPLAIAGPGVRPGVQPGYARVIDLAPTLSYLLGVLPPSLSEGRVLTEALRSGER